jgi:DNA-binding LytR/AlgR family response regulator
MRRRWIPLKDWAVDLAVATGAGAFFGAIGPFGSYFNGPAWQRAGFQVVMFWAGFVMFGTLIRVLMRFGLRGWRFWIALMAGVAVLDAPLAWLSAHLAQQIWPALRHLPVPPPWYLQALITSVPVVAAYLLLIRQRARKRRLAVEAGAAAPSRDGLLGAPASQVLCLQMEDHYVRVHTRAGSRLVLATLSQAIAAMNKTPGLQVHRSWWVAQTAVTGAVTQGRNLRLELANGVTAPVARSAVAAVRAAGWLDER